MSSVPTAKALNHLRGSHEKRFKWSCPFCLTKMFWMTANSACCHSHAHNGNSGPWNISYGTPTQMYCMQLISQFMLCSQDSGEATAFLWATPQHANCVLVDLESMLLVKFLIIDNKLAVIVHLLVQLYVTVWVLVCY